MAVHVGERGQMQAFMAGQPKGIFYRPSSVLGDAGFFLAFPDGASVPDDVRGRVFGFDGYAGPRTLATYTPRGQGPVLGSGTPADPYRQVTRYAVEDWDDRSVVSVTQTTTYVNGQGRFVTRWDVVNTTADPINFKAFAAADFYFDGDDWGTGVFDPGPPRFIGGRNVDTGRSGGFEETNEGGALGWSRYQSLQYAPDSWDGDGNADEIWPLIAASADSFAPTLRNTVIGDRVDNAAAVEWDQFARDRQLAPGASATFAVVTRAAIPATLRLIASADAAPQGVPVTLLAEMTDTDGAPIFAGRLMRYVIAGANPGSGEALVGTDGRTVLVDFGTNVGQDTIAAWIDLNGDGALSEAEPVASLAVNFVDVTPPACSVKTVKGTIGSRGRKARPVRVDVTCNEAAALSATGRVTVQVGTKRVRVKRGKRRVTRTRKVTKSFPLQAAQVSVAPGQQARLQLFVPRKYAKRYARKRGKVSVTVRALDQSGNGSATIRKRKVRMAVYPR